MPKCPQCNNEMNEVDVVSTSNAYKTFVCGHCAPDMLELYHKRSKQAMEERLNRLSIPHKYHQATAYVGQYDEECRNYKKGIIWFGESGVGKTWQMVGMIRRAIMDNKTVAYADWTSLLCQLKCNPNEYLKLLAVPNADIVAIDDFEVDNSFAFNYVYDFIKKLYCAEKIIYMTCSVLPAQDKIAMRLGEMTKQYEVKFHDGSN